MSVFLEGSVKLRRVQNRGICQHLYLSSDCAVKLGHFGPNYLSSLDLTALACENSSSILLAKLTNQHKRSATNCAWCTDNSNTSCIKQLQDLGEVGLDPRAVSSFQLP